MSAKTSSKKEIVAKVLGRRLSRALLRSRDSNTDDSPVTSRPQTAQPQPSQPRPHEDEREHESPRSSSSYTVTSQRPVSVSSAPDAKRLSHRLSLRQRIWSASPSNDFQDEDDEGEPGSAVVTSANRRSAYIPRHAASDFSKNARGNSKAARKQPSAARLAADEANDRISKRFSTFNTPREDDERTLCSLNEEPRTTGAMTSISTATSAQNTGELDDLISTLHREQALHALNTTTPGEKPPSARNRQSGPLYSWMVGQPPELDAAADSDDSSDDDEYGVYLDHGESRRRSRQADKLWVEVDAAKRQNRAPSFDGLNTNRSSFYSNRTSAQYNLQPNRNSMLSNSSSSTYSNRNSLYTTSPAPVPAPDTQDAGCGEDPVLHRNSTYLDEKTLSIPEPLAMVGTKRSSGFKNHSLSVYIGPPVLDDVRTKSPRRRPATARTPTVATVMEL
ncbi:hypothetical protein EDB80DRAFT_673840 [Ilyonectria destructans]|nr:hypothetical protein EDB80DRAFT_673840 [Ilyonectria destructans]